MRQKNGATKICKACGKSYYVPGSRVSSSNFCSFFCSIHGQYQGKRHFFKCVTCGKECEAPPSRRRTRKKYCSLECKDICRKDLSKTKLQIAAKRRLRGTERLSPNTLKKLVFSTREKSCEICNFSECPSCIEVHHIDENPFNNDLSNIKVVCCNCHRRIHRGNFREIDIKPLPK